jgi:hypothetical protein
MRLSLVAPLWLAAAPAFAEPGFQVLPCEEASAAPGCVSAMQVWGFQPWSRPAILGDTLRIAGVESGEAGEDGRLALLDLSLSEAGIAGSVALAHDDIDRDAMTFDIAPGGEAVFLSDMRAYPDAPVLHAFDAAGARLGRIEGMAAGALIIGFAANELAFADDRASLPLRWRAGRGETPPVLTVNLADGRIEAGAAHLPGDLDEYERIAVDSALSDAWTEGESRVWTVYRGDGVPSAVRFAQGGGAARTLAEAADGRYFEYRRPILAPGSRHVAVLQAGGITPGGAILLVIDTETGETVWKAAATPQATYAWTEAGNLAVIAPDPVLEDYFSLVLFDPLP